MTGVRRSTAQPRVSGSDRLCGVVSAGALLNVSKQWPTSFVMASKLTDSTGAAAAAEELRLNVAISCFQHSYS